MTTYAVYKCIRCGTIFKRKIHNVNIQHIEDDRCFFSIFEEPCYAASNTAHKCSLGKEAYGMAEFIGLDRIKEKRSGNKKKKSKKKKKC